MSGPQNLVGQILLGKLEVVRKIGGGGMGDVYEVEHRLTGHRRALKVVQSKFADRPRFMKRLLREAKVAGTLRTPYVVETFDAGRLEDGSAYVLMELLRGRSLYEAMQADGRLAPRRVAEIIAQVAEGMAVAHEAGIVHRDLKPENIFLVEGEDGDERVKILDFGVSKFEESSQAPSRLTAEGTLVGTPYYMSPEQAAGRVVDARTDVYALGVMMYESLTGRLPFEAESVGALFVKIGAGECVPLKLRRPELADEWNEIVHRAFHRDPDQRFQNAEGLRREMLQLLGGGATAARARTISDGARATIGGHEEALPLPPKTPAEAKGLLEGRAVEPDDEDAPALSAPPRSEPPRARASLPAWMWAAMGATLVLLALLPWRLSRNDDPSTPAPTTRAPAATVGRPVELAAPEPRPFIDAGVVGIAPSTVSAVPSSPRRATTKATGLDPNPYR